MGSVGGVATDAPGLLFLVAARFDLLFPWQWGVWVGVLLCSPSDKIIEQHKILYSCSF